MAYVLGAILGAALAAALQAVAVAYLVGLLIAAVVVGGAPVLLAAIVVPRDPRSHWALRPLALGAVLGLATAGALALEIHLLQPVNGEIGFVRPYVPGLVAVPLDALLVLVLSVRGARSARAAVAGADLRSGAQSLGLLAGRAVCRGVAVVVDGAGALFLVGSLIVTFDTSAPDASSGVFIVMDLVAAGTVAGLGTLFAYWGRAR